MAEMSGRGDGANQPSVRGAVLDRAEQDPAVVQLLDAVNGRPRQALPLGDAHHSVGVLVGEQDDQLETVMCPLPSSPAPDPGGRSERPGRAPPGRGGRRSVPDDGGDGVAPRDGVVGEEEHGLTAGRDLDRPADDPLAGSSWPRRSGWGRQRSALEPDADAVAAARHRPRGGRQLLQVREPVGTRTRTRSHYDRRRGQWTQRGDVHAGEARRRPPTSSTSPASSGAPEAGEHIGGPGAQDGGDGEAAAHAHVAAQPGRRCPQSQDVAVAQHQRSEVATAATRPVQGPARR